MDIKKKAWIKIIALVLCLAMIISAVPIEALANDAADTEITDIAPNDTQDEDQETVAAKPTILRELADQREANTKRFQMSDGTITAAVYTDTIHYIRDGVWQNIDNTLGADSLDSVAGYSNAKNDFNVKLAESSDSEYLMKLSKGDYFMTWSAGYTAQPGVKDKPEDSESSGISKSSRAATEKTAVSTDKFSDIKEAKKTAIKIFDKETLKFEPASEEKNPSVNAAAGAQSKSAQAPELAQAPENPEPVDERNYSDDFQLTSAVTSAAVYEDIFDNVDIEYQISGNELKENIIVKKALDNYNFDFTVTAPGLDLKILEDGSLAAYTESDGKGENTGEVIFTVPVPFMYDSNGQTSPNVHFEIHKNADGSWTLRTVADADWINSGDRVFPVVIDPAVETPRESWGIKSIQVSEVTKNGVVNRNNNYNSTMWMEVGRYAASSTEYFTSRSLIDIQLPSIETGAVPVAAYLNIRYTSDFVNTSAKQEVDLYELTTGFDESSVTWDTQPGIIDQAVDYTMTSSTGNSYPNIKYNDSCFDVTSVVKKWYENPSSHNGFGLRARNESVSASQFFKMQYVRDRTSLQVIGSSRIDYPFLTVAYRQTNGVEDYWTYTSVNAGRSGSAAVNNFSGNLVMTQPICGLSGNLMPVSISMIYNSGREINSNGMTAFADTGIGWQTNYNVNIGYSGINKYWYYLNDSDGTKHYFYFEQDGNMTNGKDEDGLGYTFTKFDTPQDPYGDRFYYQVEDKNGGKMLFNGEGYLIKIADTNNNSIKVTYGTGDVGKNKILSIIDGAGRSYTYQYGDSARPKRVTSIKDPTGKTTQFSYIGDLLWKMTFPDSQYIEFAYNTGMSVSPMTCVDRHDGTMATISYNTSNTRVSSLSWGTSSTVNTRYTFGYSTNETNITDQDDKTVTYQFNNFGQTKGIIDRVSGMAQYYEQGAPGLSPAGNTVNPTANKTVKASKVQQSNVNYICNGGLEGFGSNTGYTEETAGNNGSFGWNSRGNTGNGSARITRSGSFAGEYTYYSQSLENLPAGYYTFTGYIMTNGLTLGGTGAVLRLETWSGSTVTSAVGSEKVLKTESGEWKKVSVTTYLNTGRKLKALIGFDDGTTTGTAYFDDLQVEYSETENSRNMIQNTSFINDSDYWSGGSFSNISESEGLPGGGRALYLEGSATGNKEVKSNEMNVINGKKGDVFSFGSWAKANSASVNGIDRSTGKQATGDLYNPSFSVNLEFYNGSTKVGETVKAKINSNSTSWQFIGAEAIAPGDYTQIRYSFGYGYNINGAYFSKPYLYKENYGSSYTYDKDGNVANAVDQANTESTFAYKNNLLSKLTSPTGSAYLYSYNNTTKNLTSATSTAGQEYSFTYDNKGNPTGSVVKPNSFATGVSTSGTYYIRNAYSGNVLSFDSTAHKSDVKNKAYVQDNVNQKWKLYKPDGAANNTYCIYPVSNGNVFLSVANNSGENNAPMQLWLADFQPGFIFLITQNDDGTFTMKSSSSGYSKCIDGQPGDLTETKDDSPIYQYEYKEGDLGQKWYFYPVNDPPAQTIETSATYTLDDNYLSSVRDASGNETGYEYNQTSGLLNRVTAPNGVRTNYEYDQNNRVQRVELNDTYKTLAENKYTYDNSDRLSTISHSVGTGSNVVQYKFNYDAFGRNTGVSVNDTLFDQALVANTFNTRNLLTKVRYANLNEAYYEYDNLDRLIKTRYSNVTGEYSYVYNKQGNIGIIKDSVNNINTKFTYDLAGRLGESKQVDAATGALVLGAKYTYHPKTSLLAQYEYTLPSQIGNQRTTFGYFSAKDAKDPNKVYSVKWNEKDAMRYSYDGFARKNARILAVKDNPSSNDRYYNVLYSYADGANNSKTTGLVSKVENGYDRTYDSDKLTYNYTYDVMGRIRTVTDKAGKVTNYVYNVSGNMEREDNPYLNKTVFYTYDKGGNILKKQYYNYTLGSISGNPTSTINYGYANAYWMDKMTSYNGTAITYDGVGNPLSYRNGMSFTWQAGRQMKSATASGVTTTYKYNQDGLRTSKTVGGSETKYYLNNGVMIAEQNTGAGRAIAYLLDENNNKSGFIYNGAYYYYVFNVQGDVMGIINNSGTMMAKYTYDAWGKVLSVTDGNGVVQSSSSFIGNINPIRYRGYYYDTETGLYYLQSRYYDPETGRFVNADGYVQTGAGMSDKNMYAYCENDPVNVTDSTGKFGESYMSDCHYYYDESAPYNIPVPESSPKPESSPNNSGKRVSAYKLPEGSNSVFDVFYAGYDHLPSFKILEGDVGLGSYNAGIWDGMKQWEYGGIGMKLMELRGGLDVKNVGIVWDILGIQGNVRIPMGDQYLVIYGEVFAGLGAETKENGGGGANGLGFELSFTFQNRN